MAGKQDLLGHFQLIERLNGLLVRKGYVGSPRQVPLRSSLVVFEQLVDKQTVCSVSLPNAIILVQLGFVTLQEEVLDFGL